MKLATLKTETSKDGELCVVSQDLTKAICVVQIVPTLQAAIDNWEKYEQALNHVYVQLNNGELRDVFNFDPSLMTSPLPRAFQWLDASAYVNHVELVRKSRGVEMPANFWTDPLMYQGGSDGFLGPMDPIIVPEESFGIDFEAEVAVITDAVPMGTCAKDAMKHIRLVMLVNDVSLRNLAPEELAKGFGFVQSKPASTFSPVAVTIDELTPHWDEGRLHLPIQSYLNQERFGEPNAGVDMTFSFPELIAHAAKTRDLGAGTIIGSGTVSNMDRSKGSSCIVEKRTLELLADGKASTPYMKYGDTVQIEMKLATGQNIFGSILQTVKPLTK